MEAYRICKKQYATDFSGEGAKLFGGRWNSEGIAALYASQHISLCVLEILVHSNEKQMVPNLNLMVLNIPNSWPLYNIDVDKLKPNWQNHTSYSQFIGDNILKQDDYAGFTAPSVIIPQEFNIVLNPLFKGFKQLKLVDNNPFTLDSRLT
jgi:RES domain-containing protein